MAAASPPAVSSRLGRSRIPIDDLCVKHTQRKPFGPGEILQEELLEPAGLTQGELAELMGVPRRRVNEIIRGRRAVMPDTAMRLAKVFKTSPEYWRICRCAWICGR